MKLAGLVVAGGSGRRFGGVTNKALRRCGGKPLLVWALAALRAAAPEIHLVVAARPEDLEALRVAADGLAAAVVPGGAERQDSVRHALAAVPDGYTHVLVHDAVRPFPPAAMIKRVVAALGDGHDAVVPAVPLTDTIKRVDPAGNVVATLDRAELRAVQTPQGFARPLLWAALESAARDGVVGTDDAALVERLGHPVLTVAGDPRNRKLTVPEDARWLPYPLE